jgi:DNA-binding NarL/FixJ family response regulator
VDPTILVVDDDASVGRTWERVIRPICRCTVATSKRGAERQIAESAFHGLIVDLRLGSDSGIDVLGTFRAAHPHAPAVVITGYDGRAVLARARLLRAWYLQKPVDIEVLRDFAEEVASHCRGVDRDLWSAVESFAATHGLSERQRLILAKYAQSKPHDRIATELGIGMNTVKTQVRRLLAKLHATNLRHAVEMLQSTIPPPLPPAGGDGAGSN